MPEILEHSGAETQIVKSMSALLGRAGLEYEGKFVEVDGQRIHYLDYGQGPPVLMLHGGGAGSAIWFRQIEVLAKFHRVVVPDHPVFGLSAQHAFGSPLVESLISYLTGFMSALRLERVDLVGLSMGAQGALALAIESPDRVNRLAVIGAAGLGRAFPLVFRLATIPVFGRLITRPNRWGQDNYFKTMEVIDSEFEDAELYRQYAYDVTLTEGHSSAMRSSISAITSMVGQKSIFTDDDLRLVKAPTLAIWGEHDQVFPVEHGYRLARLVPDSSMRVIENARHVPLLDHPDEVNALLSGFFARG